MAMIELVIIGVFGAVGAVGRYLVSGWTYRAMGESFPFGTLAVNLIGCFLLGLIAQIGQTTEWISAPYRQGIAVGMLGALTTFSTFSYETLLQVQTGQWHAALANIASNVLFGITFAWAGIVAGQKIVG